MTKEKYKLIRSPEVNFKGKKGKWYHGHFWGTDGSLLVDGNSINEDDKVIELETKSVTIEPQKTMKKKSKSKKEDEPESDNDYSKWK